MSEYLYPKTIEMAKDSVARPNLSFISNSASYEREEKENNQ